MWERQGWHLVLLAGLLAVVLAFSRMPGVLTGELWGVDTVAWFWLAITVPILHQVIVTLAWRMELYQGQLSKWFGELAFLVYAVPFAILFFGRFITILILAVSNQESFELIPVNFLRLLTIILAMPTAYLFYSVVRYFGVKRALGMDHFAPEIYREQPMVRDGIFKYLSNGMYAVGLLVLWLPALWWASSAALIVALFNHTYIWVHYYCTEKPDMAQIYGK